MKKLIVLILVLQTVFYFPIWSVFAADDYGNTYSTATTISIGTIVSGNIETTGDVDYFKFTTNAAGVYTIGTNGTTDTSGSLYDSNGTSLLASNNDFDPGSKNFSISMLLSASHTYYIAVTSSGTGAYTLMVNSGSLVVQLKNSACTSSTTNQISPYFRIYNESSSTINLSTVKLRYYYTSDTSASQNVGIDFATAGTSNITATFTKLSSPVAGADYYCELGFTSGTLAAGANSEIQLRLYKSDWTNYTQTNDYSFTGTVADYINSFTATAYSSGSLVWGQEPVSATPTPTSTITPTTTPTPTPTTTPTPTITPALTPTPTTSSVSGITITTQNMTNSRLINGKSVKDANLSAELNQTQKLSFVNSGNVVLNATATAAPNNGSNDLVLLLDTSDNTVPTAVKDPSDYAIFSGDSTSDLTIKGTTVKINGDIHSNASVNFMASSFNVKGTCETVKAKPAGLDTTNYTWQGIQSINRAAGYTTSDLKFNFNVPSISIPDIDQDIRSQAGSSLVEIQDYDSKLDTYWNTTKNQLIAASSVTNQVQVKNQSVWLCHNNSYPPPYGVITFAFTGGTPLVLDSDKTYFFDGDVGFLSGLVIKANVKIVATGNIYIIGGSLDTTAGNALLYSVNKDVVCLPNDVSLFNGKIYAPHGAAKFTANNVVINGSIVAKYINDIPGTTTINCSGSSGNSGTTITKTAHLDKVKQAAVSFITALQNQAGPNKKLGVVLYNNSAYPLDSTDGYKLYSLNSASDYSGLITKVNAISSSNTTNSNMGDGIRKSLNLLSGLGSDLSRNIITLTASTPNTYTVDSTGNIYTSLSGDVGTSGVTTKTDNTGSSPLNYAKQWVSNMNTAKAGSSFINCLDNTFTDYTSVDTSAEAVGSSYSSKGQGGAGATYHYIGASSSNLSAILSNSIVQQPQPVTVTLPDTITVDATITLVIPDVGSDKCFKVKPVIPDSSPYKLDSTSGGTSITTTITNVVLNQTTSGSGIYTIAPDSIKIPDINLQYVATGKQIPKDQFAYSENIPFNKSDNNIKLTFKDFPGVSSIATSFDPDFEITVKFLRDIN
ncbi:MAG TPA: cellulose binding domain-containing protein [Clostridia bacterium]